METRITIAKRKRVKCDNGGKAVGKVDWVPVGRLGRDQRSRVESSDSCL